jgi:uncharacterized protein (DUF2141 family)
MRRLPVFFFAVLLMTVFFTRCAQIVAPTGGPMDTLPPRLLSATPPDSSLHFTSKEITLVFDEYIQLDDLMNQLIIAPNPERQPEIRARLRTLTIDWGDDTLQRNTTYTINMGDALQDINEGNPYRNFRYVFSTGDYLDSLELGGKILEAQTGAPDSMVAVMLYVQTQDSVVSRQKPLYYTRTRGDGSFLFQNLPHGKFKLFALKDANSDLQYDDSTEAIAFMADPIPIEANHYGLVLYDFLEKASVPPPDSGTRSQDQKRKLTLQPGLSNGKQDLKRPLQLGFNFPLARYDSTGLRLQEDTTYRPVSFTLTADSTRKQLLLSYPWKEEMPYQLIIDTTFAVDTGGLRLAAPDTIRFQTKGLSDYGSLTLRFKAPGTADSAGTAVAGLDSSRNPAVPDTSGIPPVDTLAAPSAPADTLNMDSAALGLPPADTVLADSTAGRHTPRYVIQLYQDDRLIASSPLEGDSWKQEFLDPGDYQVRVLEDTNGNGHWDRGCYYCTEKRQPERVYTLPGKFTVKANWDNDFGDQQFHFPP